jgi:DNA-binding IclR family transcriptional regulator
MSGNCKGAGGHAMQSVDRFIWTLELLGNSRNGLMITEIRDELQLPISSIHRMLSSLKEHGMIIQDEDTKKYRLGVRLITIASGLLNQLDIRERSKDLLIEMSNKLSRMVFLSVMEQDRVVCIDTISEGLNSNFYVKIGALMPFSAAVSAQTILAYQEKNIVDRITNNIDFVPYTKHSVMTKEDFLAKLTGIKENGYGTCIEEFQDGVNGYSAPTFNREGKCIASITILEGKTDYGIEERIRLLKETAKAISRLNGCGDDKYHKDIYIGNNN